MDKSDPLESFENEAELFYKDTGFLAPGKSESPAAIGQTDFERYEVRSLLKKAWDAGRRRRHDAQFVADHAVEKDRLLAKLQSELEEAREVWDCGHPAQCVVHEQGLEDADEVCRWCAEVGGLEQVTAMEKKELTERATKAEALNAQVAAEAVRPWREAVKNLVQVVEWDRIDKDRRHGMDHACRECPNDGSMVVKGFLCALHAGRALLSSKPAEPRKCWDPELHEIRPCDCAQNLEPCGNCDSCVNGHSGCFSPVSKKEPRSKPAEPKCDHGPDFKFKRKDGTAGCDLCPAPEARS